MSTGNQHLIECDGKPAYKCAILADRVIYTERIGKDFEDRRLREAGQVVFPDVRQWLWTAGFFRSPEVRARLLASGFCGGITLKGFKASPI